MGVREYEAQWQSILEDSMFSEAAVITDGEAIVLNVTGVFFSGSYEETSPSAYAPERLVNREFFQLAHTSVPADITDPWRTLEGMRLILMERGLNFRISEVAGKRGGTLTLSLQEVKDE